MCTSTTVNIAVLKNCDVSFELLPLYTEPDCVCRELTDLEYEDICEETLNSITDKFEELSDSEATGDDFDVSFSVGFATLSVSFSFNSHFPGGH